MTIDHQDTSSKPAGPSTEASGAEPATNGSTNGASKTNGNLSHGHVVARIPAYNEADRIGSVVLQALHHVDEVVVVDDGSTDDTSEIAHEAGATVLKHLENQGKGAAIETLFAYAQANDADALVLLDGDMQHNPHEISKVAYPVLDGTADVSLGFRFGDNTEMPAWRRAGKRVLDYATALGTNSIGAKAELTDSQCGFRAFSRDAIETLEITEGGFGVESEMLVSAQEQGLRLAEVAISCKYEGVDGSTETPVKHASGVLQSLAQLVTRKRPLLFLGVPAFLTAMLGVGLGAWVVYQLSLTGGLAIGTALLSSMLVLAGVFTGLTALMLHVIPTSIEQGLKRTQPRKIELVGPHASPPEKNGKANGNGHPVDPEQEMLQVDH